LPSKDSSKENKSEQIDKGFKFSDPYLSFSNKKRKAKEFEGGFKYKYYEGVNNAIKYDAKLQYFLPEKKERETHSKSKFLI